MRKRATEMARHKKLVFIVAAMAMLLLASETSPALASRWVVPFGFPQQDIAPKKASADKCIGLGGQCNGDACCDGCICIAGAIWPPIPGVCAGFCSAA